MWIRMRKRHATLQRASAPAHAHSGRRWTHYALAALATLTLVALIPTGAHAAGVSDLMPNINMLETTLHNPSSAIRNNACGVAAAAMILDYYQLDYQLPASQTPISIDDAARFVREGPSGTRTDYLQADLITAEAALDPAIPLTDSWQQTDSAHWFDTLQAELSHNLPVILFIPNGRNLGWNFNWGHFIVVSGSTNDGGVIYHDPWDGATHTKSGADFAHAWGTPFNNANRSWIYQYLEILPPGVSLTSSITPNATTPTTPVSSAPQWGFPFRPGLTVNIGLPENHPNSRLHDANYDTITDDTTNQVYTLSQGDGSDYASLDVGVYGGSVSSQDISDENALALAPGKVLAVEASCNAVLIDYFNGWWGIYLHLDANRIWVAAGDTVEAGTPIGVPTVNVNGCGQNTSFQHVHFAFLHNGQYVAMRGMRLCGHTVTDDGLDGVQTVPPTPPQPAPAPLSRNLIFKVPATCPNERPATNVISTSTSAGYRVLTGGVTGIRAKWVMPTVSGASDTAMNVGINLGAWQGDVQNHPDTEMAIFTFGTVQPDGSTQYTTFANIANSQQTLTVPLAAGNTMSASIIYTGGSDNNWTLTLSNLTQGQQATLTVTNVADEILPTFDIGPSTSASGLANFTPVQYQDPQVQLASGGWVDLVGLPYQATQFIENNQTVATAGAAAPSGFTVTRINLSA